MLIPLRIPAYGVAAIILAATLVFGPAAAWARCPSMPTPTVEFTEEEGDLQYDFSRSVVELTRMHMVTSMPDAFAGRRVLGLSTLRYAPRYSASMHGAQMDRSTFCVGVKTLSIVLHYSERIVYIARELPGHSCIYDQVMGHEMKHVGIDDKALKQLGPEFKRQVETALERMEPATGPTMNQAAAALEKQIHEEIERITEGFQRTRSRRQAHLDTEEEYTRVSISCGGELRRYIPADPR